VRICTLTHCYPNVKCQQSRTFKFFYIALFMYHHYSHKPLMQNVVCRYAMCSVMLKTVTTVDNKLWPILCSLLNFGLLQSYAVPKGSYTLFQTWNPFKYSSELSITLLTNILCLRKHIHTMKHMFYSYVLQTSTAPSGNLIWRTGTGFTNEIWSPPQATENPGNRLEFDSIWIHIS
jgi:hypothetical protein